MGGGGAQAMITVMRNNRNLLSKRDNYFQRGYKDVDANNKVVDHKRLSNYDRVKLRNKIKEQNRRIFFKRMLLFGIGMSVIICGFSYLLFFYK